MTERLRSPGAASLSRSAGAGALRQLAAELDLGEIRSVLARFDPSGSADRSWRAFEETVGGEVDLAIAAHRRTVARLLRSWGCRHLRTTDEAMTTRALAAWWRAIVGRLPSVERRMNDLGHKELRDAEVVFDALAVRAAARRSGPGGGESVVRFGATATAKALFMVRPLAFPPWDAAIIRSFGWRAPAGAQYVAYLEASAEALRGLARRSGVRVEDLPALLGRRSSSPAKLVDEFLWLRVTRTLSGH
jgi:hypothetical protein